MVCFFMRTWKLGWQGRTYLPWKEKEKGTDETSLRKTSEGRQERKTLKEIAPTPNRPLEKKRRPHASIPSLLPSICAFLPSSVIRILASNRSTFLRFLSAVGWTTAARAQNLGAHLSFPNAQEPNSTPPTLRQQRGVDRLTFSAPRSCKQTVLAAQRENSWSTFAEVASCCGTPHPASRTRRGLDQITAFAPEQRQKTGRRGPLFDAARWRLWLPSAGGWKLCPVLAAPPNGPQKKDPDPDRRLSDPVQSNSSFSLSDSSVFAKLPSPDPGLP
jgi:hypothetical protein